MRDKTIQQLLNEVNAIECKADRNYDWVWDYAKCRSSQGDLDMKAVETKATGLLKLVTLVFGAAWALYTYFCKEFSLVTICTFNVWIVTGLVLLFLAAVAGLLAIIPVRQFGLFSEEVGIGFINRSEKESNEPKARFSLGVMICSNLREKVMTLKSLSVLIGFTLLIASLGCLVFGLHFWMPLSCAAHGSSEIDLHGLRLW